MPEPRSSRITDAESADPRWKDLYRIGGIASILITVAILFAIAAFFIWPFKPGGASTADIFAALQAFQHDPDLLLRRVLLPGHRRMVRTVASAPSFFSAILPPVSLY